MALPVCTANLKANVSSLSKYQVLQQKINIRGDLKNSRNYYFLNGVLGFVLLQDWSPSK